MEGLDRATSATTMNANSRLDFKAGLHNSDMRAIMVIKIYMCPYTVQDTLLCPTKQ